MHEICNFPSGNASIATVRRCCDGVIECYDTFSNHLLWNHMKMHSKIMRQFPQRRTLKVFCWVLKEIEKTRNFFCVFFEKFFKKNHENSKNYQNGFLRKIAAKIVKNSKNSKKSFENRIMIFVFNYFNFFCYKMLK